MGCGCGNRECDFQVWFARLHLQARQATVASSTKGGRYTWLLVNTAQAMRASLLASATIATLRCVRPVSCASHALKPGDCFALRCITDLAPCTNNLRRY